MEGDMISVIRAVAFIPFQSTPSAWRETVVKSSWLSRIFYFNPLPPHGGRHSDSGMLMEGEVFQSTPSAWRETVSRSLPVSARTFQSTPSAWRETADGVDHTVDAFISIHSLRMEGDGSWWKRSRAAYHFNPLPPHGGRHPKIRASRTL